MGLALADHEMTRAANGCAYAVIEASWVYWKPLRRIIEANLHMMFDQQSRNVLGHITDVDNAMWIVMSAHGLNR